MASQNETLIFVTHPDHQFSTTVTGFNGHTATLQFEDEGGYQDYLDVDGNVITSTVDIQGTFTAPTKKSQWLIVPGTGDLAINVSPIRTA